MFDEDFYRRRYLPTDYTELSPYEHFLRYGFLAWNNPSPLIDLAYVKQHLPHLYHKNDAELTIQLISEYPFNDHISPSPFVCPRWIRLQLYFKEYRSFADYFKKSSNRLFLHPLLDAVDYNTFSEAVLAEDMTRISFFDCALYAANYADVSGHSYELRHFLSEGLYQGRRMIWAPSRSERPRLRKLDANSAFEEFSNALLNKADILFGSQTSSFASNSHRPLDEPDSSLVTIRLADAGLDVRHVRDVINSPDALGVDDNNQFSGELDLINSLLNNAYGRRRSALVTPFVLRGPARRVYVFNEIIKTAQERSDKFCIYSVNIGGYDKFFDAPRLDNVDMYMITDSPVEDVPDTWKIIRPPWIHTDPKKASLWFKTHCTHLFSNFVDSLWIDSNIRFYEDVVESLENWRSSSVIRTFRHPDRNCIYDEAKAVVNLNLEAEDVVDKYVKRIRSQGFPEQLGLHETNVLYRRHDAPNVTLFNKKWWREILLGPRRDQMSFDYCSWYLHLNVHDIDGQNSIKRSRVFYKVPHTDRSQSLRHTEAKA
ncbi:glycosyltransferase domain-containing protein [Jiella sonneratiae]|uniref:DUF616 domain-containing protein n=1 Tax=Jiella sonneratiae TaxID=2816856 RepID=A0ABS3JDA9_9HYPH|nr:glycosyltransferase domain-containing protein [Jiella sonneratiae]MBO0906551.1 DUF616 domain-containing protein [Jiella sonneratiae]